MSAWRSLSETVSRRTQMCSCWSATCFCSVSSRMCNTSRSPDSCKYTQSLLTYLLTSFYTAHCVHLPHICWYCGVLLSTALAPAATYRSTPCKYCVACRHISYALYCEIMQIPMADSVWLMSFVLFPLCSSFFRSPKKVSKWVNGLFK